MIQQRSCEALFVAGRIKEAGESVLRVVERKTNMTKPIDAWVVGEQSFSESVIQAHS